MNLGEDERQLQAERMMIEEIKKRPFLWDETLPEHKDMEKARTAWENVGRLFGMSGTKAKSRWKSMRDIYVRYLRKLALKGGSVPKWKHFEAMNFIADHIKHRRGDLQYTNFSGGMLVSNANSGDADKPGAFLKYDVLHNSDDDEDAPGGSGSKRVTRGRKRKRMAAAAAAAAATTPAPSTPRTATTAALRLSQNAPGASSSTSVSASLMPVLSAAMVPSVGSPMSTATVIGLHQQQPQQQTPGHPQHMTMIGTGLVPVTSIGCVATTSSGLSGSRGINGQETASFTAIPIDEDADDLFGRAVAATLKKMPPRMKALSKLRIQQVLYELEEASSSTPPPNAVIYQSAIGGPTSQQPQQQQPPPPPQGFM